MRTCPSLISRWICDRERSPATETRKRSRRTLSASVGTVNVRLGTLALCLCACVANTSSLRLRRLLGLAALQLGYRRLRAPRQVDEHADGKRRKDDRDELRGREDADRAAFVPAVE